MHAYLKRKKTGVIGIRISIIQVPPNLPWVDFTVDKDHSGAFVVVSAVVEVGIVDRVVEQVLVKLVTEDIFALFDEKVYRYGSTERLVIGVGGLIESEFHACLIGPLFEWKSVKPEFRAETQMGFKWQIPDVRRRQQRHSKRPGASV